MAVFAPVFSCFFEKRETRHAAAGAVAQQKTRRGMPPGPVGAVSVNTLFSKILVT
jgi:hypothetical protein